MLCGHLGRRSNNQAVPYVSLLDSSYGISFLMEPASTIQFLQNKKSTSSILLISAELDRSYAAIDRKIAPAKFASKD